MYMKILYFMVAYGIKICTDSLLIYSPRNTNIAGELER